MEDGEEEGSKVVREGQEISNKMIGAAVCKNKYSSYCASDLDPEKDKILQHGHNHPKASTRSNTKLSEIMEAIDNIANRIESLDAINKQAAISHLQECVVFLQLASDIPQLDGNLDLDPVIFCDICNHEFLGNSRVRDRQTHYINGHFRNRFQENTPSKSDNYFKCTEPGCEFKTTKKLDFWRHKGGKHNFIDCLLREHFDQNPPLIPANGTVNLDHEYGMVTEKSQGDSEDNGVKQVSVGEENCPRLVIPQGGDGISPSSETKGGSSGSYNRNTDIEVSRDYATTALQVRRGSEAALNKIEASGGEGGRPSGSGHSSYTGENEQSKRCSVAVLNRDVRSSKTDLSVIDEASFYSYTDQHLDPHRGLSPLPPPFERGQGSGAARDSDRPNPFARDANRLSIQIGHEDGRWLEAAEKASEPSHSRQNLHGLDDIGLGYRQDSGRGSQEPRQEPLGGSNPPQPPPKQNNIDNSKLTRFVIQNDIGLLDIPASSVTKCQQPGHQNDSSISVSVMEEENAVASILGNSFREETESLVNNINNSEETANNSDIKFNLPNNASYLVDKNKNCGKKVGDLIALLFKRRSQKSSSFEAFVSDTEPLDLSEDCSRLTCGEVWVYSRVQFRLLLQLLDKVTLEVKASETEVIEEVLSNIVAKYGLTLADLEVSVSRYGGHLEGVDLRQSVTTIDNTLVVIKRMTAAADETQELVDEDECPRTSTPVPGHDEDSPFFNTTDILLREHSYSRVGSVSFSEHQNLRSVSGYHSLSVSEMEEADRKQTNTTSPGLSDYTASCPSNQMPGSFGDGCARMDATRAQVTVDPGMLEAVVRYNLNITAKSTMVVSQPLKVTVVGGLEKRDIAVPDFPNEPDKGTHKISLESPFYIERSDFKEKMESGYRRLCPGQTVGLRYAGLVLKLEDVVKTDGIVTEIKVKAIPVDQAAKPKAFIHWAADGAPSEVRMYSKASSVTGAALPQVNTSLASSKNLEGGGEELEEVGPVPSVHEVVVPGSDTALANFFFLTPDGQQSQPSAVKFKRGAPTLTQSLRTKWTETGSKKVEPKKINAVSRKIKKPEKTKRKVFTMEELELASSILHSSRRVYTLLRTRKVIHLPHPRTIYRHLQRFKCPPGLSPQIFRLFRLFLSELEPEDRICVLLEDEMKLESRISWCPRLQRLFPAHKNAQVAMARGIRKKWRFPLMYEFDMNMTLDKLMELVTWVEEAGAECVANTCDMGNKTLLSDQGFDVTGGGYYLDHPVRPGQKLYQICDPPHLIKLFRNHILDSGAEWTREDGRITRVSISCLEDLLKKDSAEGEIRKLYKITDDHLYCVGTARQRVKPAVQLLSSSVANAFCEAGDIDKGELIQIIDDWFDVFDSRTRYHSSKQLKNGLGVHEEKQVNALNKMMSLMKNITFGGKLKPFMKGIIASTKSLLALWDDLKGRGWSFICTHNLNQDILELYFSNIRSLCGTSDHPRANNFGSRFRILMLSSNCMKVLINQANVSPAENNDEQEWTMFSLGDGAADDFMEESNDGLIDLGDEEDLERELGNTTDKGSLQYISGYIAHKLGLTTRAPEEGSWIWRQSRPGCSVGLVRASDEVEEWVRLMDVKFNVLHKSMTLRTGSNMLKRTVNFILRREECRNIPVRVVTLFVKVKFFHRLKCLNNRLKYAKKKKHRSVRDARKVAQFQN